MRFGATLWLWLLLLLPALATLAVFSRVVRLRRLLRFASPSLLPRLVAGRSAWRSAVGGGLRIAAVGLIVLALGRPQWGRRDEPVVRRGVDVAIALDLSSSMLAEDVAPSRLEQARAQVGSLLDSLKGDRVAFVVFGGRAALQCPLTVDYGAVRLFLDAASPLSAPGPGTDVGRAIEEASKVFDAAERRYKTIVLVTDGEDNEARGLEAARRAASGGVVIHVLGVGTARGGPIPLRDETGALTGYQKDHQGRVVTTRFDGAGLEKIALASGGLFVEAGPAGEEGRRIAEAIGQMEKKEIASRIATRFEDRFQIPLVAAILLIALEPLLQLTWRRQPRAAARTALATAALLVMASAPRAPLAESPGPAPAHPAPSPAESAEPAPDGGKAPTPAVARRNRDGNTLYHRGEYADALSRYEEASAASPGLPALRYNIGNALYRQGRYQEAASEYQRALAAAGQGLAPAARYNLGNAEYQMKRYGEAADAYRRVLQTRPGDEQARRNLELALRAMRRPPENPSSNDSGKNSRQQEKSGASRNESQGQQGRQEARPQTGAGEDRKEPSPQEPQRAKDDGPGSPEPQNDARKDADGSGSPDSRDRSGEGSSKTRKGGGQGAENRLDRREAEKLLDSLAEEEKRDLRRRLARRPRESGPEKDW